jgi:hypothetical protein
MWHYFSQCIKKGWCGILRCHWVAEAEPQPCMGAT